MWTIPAGRTKMRREHRKPLPGLAVEILTELKKVTGHAPYVFTSQLTWRKPLSENTLNAALRRLGYSSDEHVSHGFRRALRASSTNAESGAPTQSKRSWLIWAPIKNGRGQQFLLENAALTGLAADTLKPDAKRED